MNNPLEFNPLSNKKFDFTKNIPEAPKELDTKKKTGVSDEDIIRAGQNEPEPAENKTVIINKEPDLPPPI